MMRTRKIENTVATIFVTLVFFSSSVCRSEEKISSIETFKRFVQQNPQVRHVEEALPHFKSTVFSRHALVYQSRSLQGASIKSPRIIYFSDDGRFILAMNGDPSQRGYNALEMMEFHESTAKFEAFAYVFPGDTERMVKYRQENNQDTHIAPLPDCRSCHRQDIRPNWDNYTILPGVYEGPYSDQYGETVRKGFEEFYAKSGMHPRYRYAKDETRRSFGNAVSPQNYKRIIRKIKENQNFERFKFALLGSVGGCEDVQDFIPFDPAAHGMKTFAEMMKDMEARGTKYVRSKVERLQQDPEYVLYRNETIDGNRFADTSSGVAVAAMRFVAQWMNLSMEDWSMVRDEGTFGMREAGHPFSAGEGYYNLPKNSPDATVFYNREVPYPAAKDKFFAQLAAAVGAEDIAYFKKRPEPFATQMAVDYDFPDQRSSFAGYVNCDALKRESRKALSGWKPNDVAASSVSKKTH